MFVLLNISCFVLQLFVLVSLCLLLVIMGPTRQTREPIRELARKREKTQLVCHFC